MTRLYESGVLKLGRPRCNPAACAVSLSGFILSSVARRALPSPARAFSSTNSTLMSSWASGSTSPADADRSLCRCESRTGGGQRRRQDRPQPCSQRASFQPPIDGGATGLGARHSGRRAARRTQTDAGSPAVGPRRAARLPRHSSVASERSGGGVVVFDARSETDPLAGVVHWDRALRAAHQRQGEEAVPLAKLLVSARADRGGVPVSKERLDALIKEFDFAAYYATSAKEGWQVEELRAAIERANSRGQLPTVTSSALFATIKSSLLDVRTPAACSRRWASFSMSLLGDIRRHCGRQ